LNNFLRYTCGAAALLASAAAFAADSVRAGYEVTLTDGKDTWRANTVVPVEPGQPIQQGLGPYVVSMNVKEEKANKYNLLVRVSGLPGTATENAEYIRKSFAGDHKQQLEFAASEAGLAVKGVIFVGPPKSAAK
jgi:hypothetical protein